MWRTLRRFGVRESALEDAAQDVFLIAHRKAGAWDEASIRRRGKTLAERAMTVWPSPDRL